MFSKNKAKRYEKVREICREFVKKSEVDWPIFTSEIRDLIRSEITKSFSFGKWFFVKKLQDKLKEVLISGWNKVFIKEFGSYINIKNRLDILPQISLFYYKLIFKWLKEVKFDKEKAEYLFFKYMSVLKDFYSQLSDDKINRWRIAFDNNGVKYRIFGLYLTFFSLVNKVEKKENIEEDIDRLVKFLLIWNSMDDYKRGKVIKNYQFFFSILGKDSEDIITLKKKTSDSFLNIFDLVQKIDMGEYFKVKNYDGAKIGKLLLDIGELGIVVNDEKHLNLLINHYDVINALKLKFEEITIGSHRDNMGNDSNIEDEIDELFEDIFVEKISLTKQDFGDAISFWNKFNLFGEEKFMESLDDNIEKVVKISSILNRFFEKDFKFNKGEQSFDIYTSLFWIRVIDRFKNINISSLRRRLESAQDILKKIYEEVKKKSLEDTSWKIEEKKKIKKIIEAAVVCLILELARRPGEIKHLGDDLEFKFYSNIRNVLQNIEEECSKMNR